MDGKTNRRTTKNYKGESVKKFILVLALFLIISFLFTSSARAAQGWLSDSGLLSLKISDKCVKGIPIQVGYIYTITYDKWTTKIVPLNMMSEWKMWGLKYAGLIVNGEYVHATRLGNGWLFEFKEVEKEISNANYR